MHTDMTAQPVTQTLREAHKSLTRDRILEAALGLMRTGAPDALMLPKCEGGADIQHLGALVAVLVSKAVLEERWMLLAHPGYAAYRRDTCWFLPWIG